MRPDTVPLAGTSPELLVKEIETTAAKLDLEALSAKVADRPLLVIGAEYAGAPTSRKLAAAARAAGAKDLTETYFPTDHSFSDSRIALEAEVLRWLGRFDPASAKPAGAFTPLKAAYDEANPFARILRGEQQAPKIYEDDQVLVFMDRAPAEIGHALVISKTSKARNMLEIAPADLARHAGRGRQGRPGADRRPGRRRLHHRAEQRRRPKRAAPAHPRHPAHRRQAAGVQREQDRRSGRYRGRGGEVQGGLEALEPRQRLPAAATPVAKQACSR
jgi:hypothetical protein